MHHPRPLNESDMLPDDLSGFVQVCLHGVQYACHIRGVQPLLEFQNDAPALGTGEKFQRPHHPTRSKLVGAASAGRETARLSARRAPYSGAFSAAMGHYRPKCGATVMA